MSDRPSLVVLAGPTAVGKTALAVHLCREFGAEVVGADSVQVYRGLDIGSAKPTAQEQALAPHHLVDVAEPDEPLDAAAYARLADQAIAGLARRGKRVIVAGGSGLYIKALLQGLAPAPPVDPALRAKLAAQWEKRGPQAMHARLAELDPQAADRLHPNDRQRVLRALEVCLQTGEPFSRLQQRHGFQKSRYPHLLIGLTRPREELNRRIELRCRQMWEQGLLQEVEGLLKRGVPPQARPLQSLGYRHALMVLLEGMDPAEALMLMIRDTKAYAKRQTTWFRGLEGIHWHLPDDLEGVSRRVRKFWKTQGERP